MKRVILLLPLIGLTACTSWFLPGPGNQSDEQIAARRANVRALEAEDYQIERKRRQDTIEDIGTMEMNRAKAINKSYENRSKQSVTILH